ncbi:PHB depolymerase family esterase [Siccirubricoccus sp. G192]|uniref:extracellular catalytic domain type 1 short-chain-length polyhydroxyalkanoate depolymerase n=1 Tax=Siccirubricoccus sp. G192 TaxID=2849651 RepID=UPI0020C3BF0A|nr:PHB depolymerase family esterase [Siccirubricoccus sp. G192]
MFFARRLGHAALGLSDAMQAALARTAMLGRVVEVSGFGSNPGALRMLAYAPPRLPAGRPLVVVLHGCGQDAAGFAADAGWLALAQRLGVALLLPEQGNANNRGRCFNWYRPADVRRGGGEAMSIRQMLRAAIGRYGSDPRRVFIAGFSAGGGMAAAMLAAYPAVFAAGGVVAGMPVGCAGTSLLALQQMHRAGGAWRSRRDLADAVRAATPPRPGRPWPRLSIWQGGRDRTVDPANAEILAAQWSELHGCGAEPATEAEVAPGLRRLTWGRPGGKAARPAVELWRLARLGHGFPVDPRGAGGGREGAWVVDAGLSAAQRMAEFWGISSGRR